MSNRIRKRPTRHNRVSVPSIRLPDLNISHPASFFYAGRLEELPPSFVNYSSPHRHDYYALFFFVSGSGSHELDFQQFAIEPGSVFLLKPGQVHSWRLEEGFSGFSLKISREFCAAVLGGRQLSQDFPAFSYHANHPKILTGHKTMQLKLDFERLVKEFKVDTDAHFLFSIVSVILHEICRLTINLVPRDCSPTGEFLKLLDENIHRERGIRFYAYTIGISEVKLNRICQMHTGKTAGQLIRERLLLEVRRFLVHSNIPIQEVARELGFSDPSYFSRFVKKNCGVSPESLRDHVKKVL